MAKVFLDTNILIDLVEKRTTPKEELDQHELYISPLSIHILVYVTKQKIPNSRLSDIIEKFYLMTLSESVAKLSLEGPTTDFEDNVQLHSAAESECDFFLTNDRKMLAMGFFGKVHIVPAMTPS